MMTNRDPTAEEIEKRAAEIRATWDEDQRLKRSGYVEPKHVQPPVIDTRLIEPPPIINKYDD